MSAYVWVSDRSASYTVKHAKIRVFLKQFFLEHNVCMAITPKNIHLFVLFALRSLCKPRDKCERVHTKISV